MRTQKIIGAILCAIAFVFASGETMANGALGVAFLLPGVILVATAEQTEEYKKEDVRSKSEEFAKAA